MVKKLAISIGHHTLGDAMKPHSLLKIEVGNMRSIIGGMVWHGMKCAILEIRSTTTIIESLFCWVLGNPMMKSRLISSQGA